MGLHEEKHIGDTLITRVIGGWIYATYKWVGEEGVALTSCFVPEPTILPTLKKRYGEYKFVKDDSIVTEEERLEFLINVNGYIHENAPYHAVHPMKVGDVRLMADALKVVYEAQK